MKKVLFSTLAASTLLLAASCSQDDELVAASGSGEQSVTLKVQLPGSAETRAIAEDVEVGKGNMANTLVYALYEKGKEDQTPLILGQKEEDTDGVFVITVPMAKDLQYELLLLAYNEENCAFNVKYNADDLTSVNLQNLTLKSSLSANQEAYDAFVGHETVSVNAEAVTVINLKRPFAQVNAATTAADLADAETLKAVVASSQLVIEDVPTVYNIFTGEASSTADLTYTDAAILKNTENTHETLTVGEESYNYLTLAYVLAGENATSEKSLHNATFTFNREDGTTVSTISVANLPIQRNYRTNVIGSLLTSSESYKVVIDETFNEPAHIASFWDGKTLTKPAYDEATATWTVTNAAEYAWLCNQSNPAAKNGGTALTSATIEIVGDINLNNYQITGISVARNAEVTVNANGHTVSNAVVVSGANDNGTVTAGLFVSLPDSKVNINDLNVKGINVVVAEDTYADRDSGPYAGVICGYVEGTLSLNNVNVADSKAHGLHSVGGMLGFVAAYGSTTINNCTVDNVTLTDSDVDGESGAMGGLVGRVAGSLTVENATVSNSTIEAYVGTAEQQKRSVAKYIGNFVGGGTINVTNGAIENVTIDAKNELASTQSCLYGDFLGGWRGDGGTVTINGVTIEKDNASIVTTAEQLAAALTNAQDGDVVGFEGEIAITDLKAGANVTIVGMSEDATLNATSGGNYTDCSGNITFKNLTIKLANNRDHFNVGLHNQGGTHVYENCNFEGIATAWGNCTYNNCTFTNSVDGKYAAWVYAGTVVYNNCEFNGVDRAAKVFNENAESGLNVTYNDCTFKATGTNDDKTAVEVPVMNNTDAATIVTINNATIENMKKAEHYGTEVFNIEYLYESPLKFGNGIVTVDGETYAVVCKEAAIKTVMGMNSKNITMNLCQDTELNNGTSAAWGGVATETVKIGSVSTDDTKKKLTLSNGYRDYVQTNGAKVVLENVVLASSQNKSTHWHAYAPKFSCDVEMTGVDMLNSFCFEKKAVLNNITMNCSWPSAVYALWVVAGADVTIAGADITSVRGIKITDEDASAEKATLKVSNAKFTTTAKAAILATTKYGADITVSGLDLSGVAEDQTNAVWVDSERADYFDLVTVSGGTKVQE